MKKYNNCGYLTPFKMCIIDNFPFIEEDFDAITNYQLLCKVVEYLNKVIASENEQNKAIKEIQDFLNTLDLQDEVDKKLDEMAESGELQEIIASYLNAKAIFCFDTVSDMKSATNLINGSYAETLGYYSKNDGGRSLYLVRTLTNEDVVDEMLILSLSDENLVAELVESQKINVKQLGAYGDNTHDDTDVFKTAVDNFTRVYIPDGTYKITDSIEINSQTQLIGESMNNTILMGDTSEYIIKYLTEVKANHWDIKSNILLKNFKCLCKNFFQVNSEDVADADWEYQASVLHILVDSVWVLGTYTNATDSNKDSNVLPNLSELLGYGCAFDWNNVFDSQITNCQIQEYGLGIFLKGCDINKIDLNRFTVNGCQVFTQFISTYGSQTMILNNDILANKRYGAIRINGTYGDTIENNYFETYTNASCYIYTDDESGLSILNNRITNPGIANISVIHICPRRCDKIINNRTTDRDINMYVEIDYSKTNATSYPLSHRNNTVLYFLNNDTDLLLKDKLLVVTENYNPLIVSPYNLKYNNSMIYGTSFMIQNPFLLNSTYNTYYFNNASGTGYIHFKDAIEYYGRPLKVRYYYVSTSATQLYRVVDVDSIEIARGNITDLVADSKLHYVDDDLTDVTGNIGNEIKLTIPAVSTIQIFKVELI